MKNSRNAAGPWCRGKVAALAALTVLLLGPINASADTGVQIDQQPLTLDNNVPGNVVLTPSVEFPTVISMSNLGSFSSTSTYGGYFDPAKCYSYDSTGAIPTSTPAPQMAEPKGATGYFVPASMGTAPATCNVAGQWSGNYLNWAATQTIDTFRSVMTGGYRVIDNATTTVLEKARHTGQQTTGRLSLSGSATVKKETPSTFGYFYTKLDGLGNKMYFVSGDSKKYLGNSLSDVLNDPVHKSKGGAVIPYTGQSIEEDKVYSVNIDVQVCKSADLLETNCVKYGSNYKPEGLIQKYSKNLKYSVFGYLNIAGYKQDGAALRAQQKFVGPNTYDPLAGTKSNPAAEWNSTTGVFYKNPDSADAASSTSNLGVTIADSGVINYLNKFGEMMTGGDKDHDPVSEMYYEATRYLKGQTLVGSYSDVSNASNALVAADGFPVIKSPNDPILYSCQKNFILGIGDVNTWEDKNLPGNSDAASEPAVPTEVSSDKTINVVTATNQVGKIEGISNLGDPTESNGNTGRNNSFYIAGLAYDVHTKDMRPDFPGMQTASTFWVDVEEKQILLPMNRNQYLLATKYGGFAVPPGYSPYTNTTALPLSEWSTTGDMLTTSNVNQHRPDNFFEGGNAAAMRKGLSAAFSAIADANAGSSSSLALNSTQLNNGSTIYQASYVSGSWSGALKAIAIDPVSQLPLASSPNNWTATIPASSRTVYTLVGGQYKAFNSTNVTGNGWTADTVNYILGDRSNEVQNGGTLRNRTTVLGDVIDSQPVYVGAPDPNLFNGATFTGSTSYATHAKSTSVANRTPVVYVEANDGMLHGFNAKTGVEIYAYMPGAVEAAALNPSVLSKVDYGSTLDPHQYFNDGELTVSEAYFSTDSKWHTVLVGTTGRGTAKAIYALDVTDPTNVVFLWEVSGATDQDIGQTVGKPIIAQTQAGWVVLIGNGYNSTNGTAALLSIPLDGSDHTPTVYTTNTDTDNGLATPGVWIANTANDISTTAYAGDIKGNLWSFDLSSSSGAGTKVFSTQANQPITATVALGKDPATNHLWAFFGTGKYLTSGDLSTKNTQSWYGIIVDGTLPVNQADLVQRSIVAETAAVAANPNATPPTPAVSASRAFSEATAGDMTGKSGWYIDLLKPASSTSTTSVQEGERMLVSNQFVGGYLVGASLIPDTSNACAPGGRGWVMALNPFTGANPDNLFFDMNGDGVFNDSDKVKVGDNLVASGGIGFGSLIGLPAFIGASMFNNLNGLLQHTNINPTGGHGGRVSWREIVY